MNRSQYTLRANSNFSHIRCTTLTVHYPSAMLNLRRKLLTTIGIVGSRDFPAGRARASLTCLHLQLKGYPRRPMQRQLIDVIFSNGAIFSGQSLHQEGNFARKYRVAREYRVMLTNCPSVSQNAQTLV